MPRRKIEFRTASRENYKDFCKKHPSINLSFDEWRNIIYSFNDSFRNYILETGDAAKLPYGFGDFTVNKKKRRKMKGLNDEFINLHVDWKKTKEKGKIIYNFNYHTEGYFFGWIWFKETARFKHSDLWYFKPTRVTSRLLAHYIQTNDKYQHIYRTWKI
jgi:nucleoid DNA-binding protein